MINFDFKNIQIDDLQNIAELGSYVCGNYESLEDGGHRNQNWPLQRGFTGTEVHALSFVASQGEIDKLKIYNIVSARGDALAMQFFPSNEIIVGKNIIIHDIHAGAALPKDVLLSLDDNMPNKIPRACAVTIWTWTDEDSGFTENQISFVDKEAITAKCLTYHTECSDSDYDKEALIKQIKECDHTTIVKKREKDNAIIYKKYISKISDDHRKLLSIMDDHKMPNFYPKRAFPHKYNNKTTFTSIEIVYILIASIVIFAAYKFTRPIKKNKYITQKPQKETNEYEPLIDIDAPDYKDYTVQ